MSERGSVEDPALAAVIADRVASLSAVQARAAYLADRRKRAEQRLDEHFRETDSPAYALRRFHRDGMSVGEVLECAGVGRWYDDGLVGGGSGASAPDDADFDAKDLPESIRGERAGALANGDAPTAEELAQWRTHRAKLMLAGENADQFDFWKLAPNGGSAAYAISWRASDGRICDFDGFYDSIEAIRAALNAKYDVVSLWFNDA